MVKPEKFGHLHLVYHFTVPLIVLHQLRKRRSQPMLQLAGGNDGLVRHIRWKLTIIQF